MKYRIYKLKFRSVVHFGENSLDKSSETCMADTLFSALFLEAMKMGTDIAEQFYHFCKQGELLFTDALPYIDDTYYLPKPLKRLRYESDNNSKVKKSLKKLKYIPYDQLEDYLAGTMDIVSVNQRFANEFGKHEMKVSASIKGLEETMPFHVDSFRYYDGSGLYVIVGFESDEADAMFGELIEALGYCGIGGERSSGYGRFEARIEDVPVTLEQMICGEYVYKMNLSVCLPKDDELDDCLVNAEYGLVKRSGFIDTSAGISVDRRKRDIYMFRNGSTFTKHFPGDIFDVSIGDTHPVYRYGKAFWIGVIRE